MKISDKYREIIIEEIKYALKMMDKASSGEEILFYFSAVYGIIQRIFNLEFDPELIFAHFVLSATYQNFKANFEAVKQGRESMVILSELQIKRLSILTKELLDNIQKKSDIDDTLKKFIVLSYSTTGNGYYLYNKGILKI